MIKKLDKNLHKLDGLLKFMVASALLAVPLFPKFPFIRIPGTFVSIRLEDFILLILGVLLAIYTLPYVRQFLLDKINRAILIYLAIGLVSVLTAILVTKTAPAHIGILHWLRRLEYFLAFFVGVLAINRDRDNLGFYFKTLLLVLFLTFLYGYGQKEFSWPIIITQNMEYSKGVALRWIPGSHINSTFAGHYDLASFLVMFMPLVVSGIFVLKGKFTKAAFTICFVAGLWLMANASSRISVVTFLMSSSLALVFVRKIKAIPVLVVISIIVFAMSSNLLVRYGRIIDVVKLRLSDVSVQLIESNVYAAESAIPGKRVQPTPTPPPPPVVEDRSTSIRLNVEWPRAIRAFSKNPLLGTGYSSITLATDNDYLRALGEVGLFGFLAFALIFFRLINNYVRAFPLVKNFKDVELVFIAGMIGALPGLLVNAVFIDIFEASKFAILFWMCTGFAVGIISAEINKKSS